VQFELLQAQIIANQLGSDGAAEGLAAEKAVVQAGSKRQLDRGSSGEAQTAAQVEVDLSVQRGREEGGVEIPSLQGRGEGEGGAPVKNEAAAELTG
jgi:hypothetical protein